MHNATAACRENPAPFSGQELPGVSCHPSKARSRRFQATSCDLAGTVFSCCHTPRARGERGFGVLEKKHSWGKEGLALEELNQSAPQPALRVPRKWGWGGFLGVLQARYSNQSCIWLNDFQVIQNYCLKKYISYTLCKLVKHFWGCNVPSSSWTMKLFPKQMLS